MIKTTSPEQTRSLGLRLGRILRRGDLVCLYGTLGSGKTTLTRGLARGAGYRGRVMSPTFGLARVYRGRRALVYHLDLYRVGPDETGDVGIEDYVRDPSAVCVVEWPEAGRAYYPRERLELRFSHADGGKSRRIGFKALGPRPRYILMRLKA